MLPDFFVLRNRIPGFHSDSAPDATAVVSMLSHGANHHIFCIVEV